LSQEELRTPEAIYVHRGSILFKKRHGVITYNILKWIDPRKPTSRQESIAFGIYKGEEQLEQFNKCKTLEQVLAIHGLGSVT